MKIDVRSRECVYLSIYGYTVYVDFSGDKKPFVDTWRDDDDDESTKETSKQAH